MNLLLLAGTAEARDIARALSKMPVNATASLAGATRQPADLAVPTRHGGFGGGQAFRQYLIDNKIAAVLDATHPFAADITRRTAKVCSALKVSYAQVLRPEWKPQNGDDWTFFDLEKEVAGFVPFDATIFLGTGPGSLPGFKNLEGRKVICRRIDPAAQPFPFSGGTFLVGRPPFSVEDEISLFQELGVDWLVVKNSGGDASRSKLDAARHLGIRVALQNRPEMPEATRISTVAAALGWVRNLI